MDYKTKRTIFAEDSPFFLMKKALKTLISTILLLPLGLLAQGVDDAICNSQTFYEGTSRSMAMGNATGALGGDITSICINPAGMGLYRTQEFTFTTGLQQTFMQSTYYGYNQNAGNWRMTIPNMGLVFCTPFSNYGAVRYVQFGIGFTRTNDFNYNSKAYGLNPNSSMMDAYLQAINDNNALFNPNTDPGDYLSTYYPFDLSPAWETYLIDQYTDESGEIYYDSPVPKGNVYQTNEVNSRGRSEEWTFALSANLYDKLYVGTSLGLRHIRRSNIRTYSEMPGNPSDPNNLFDNWEFIETLGDTAWGVNFNCGLIYYPTSWLRIGAAWHSRTRYAIGEYYDTETSAMLRTNPGGEYYHRYYSPSLYQTYEFKTPHTFVGSLAFFIGKQGLITADVEYLNYGTSRFISYEYSFSDVNNNIKDILKPTFNIRIGTEFRYRQYFFRGGVAYYGSPYGFGDSYGSVKKAALGLGFATSENSTWDFAYELSESMTGYTPYGYYENNQNMVEAAVQHRWRNKLMVTYKLKL